MSETPRCIPYRNHVFPVRTDPWWQGPCETCGRTEEELEAYDPPVLCYVSGPFAYFTTCPLDKQWGDGWGKTPYEHNAGSPYDWREDYDGKRGVPKFEISRVAWDGPFDTPADRAGGNSAYSVQQINRGDVAWLAPERWLRPEVKAEAIHAGTTLPEFIRKIEAAGGTVYLPRAKVAS